MGMKEIASRLIKKHGQETTLLRPGAGVTDGLGSTIPGPDTSFAVIVLSATYAIDLEILGGGFVDWSRQRVLISVEGLTVEPKNTDVLMLDGERMELRNVKPLAPAGFTLFWDCEVRHV